MGPSAGSASTRRYTSPMPTIAPIDASRRFSARSCRASRPRSAPIATRTVSSCRRAIERARTRFATFARDQQDQRDGAQQKQEGRTNVSDNRFAPALHRDVYARILRKLFPDLCGEEPEIRLRLCDGHAGLQAADHIDKVVRPGVHRVARCIRFRGPDFSACIGVVK